MPPRGSNVNNSARKSTSGGRRNTANDTSTTAPPDTTPTSSSGIPPRPPLGTARAGVNNVGTSNDTAAEVAALRGKSLSNSKPRHSPFHAASLEKAQADLQKANQTIATINTPVANAGRGRANNEEQIPKPKGTAGERGGFNLQAEMGLGDDKEQYNTIMVRWHLCSCVSGFTHSPSFTYNTCSPSSALSATLCITPDLTSRPRTASNRLKLLAVFFVL